MYLGLRTSVIYYNTSIPSWVWYDRKAPESVAVSISPEASLLLGLPRTFNIFHFVKVFTVLTFLGWEMTSATLGWASQGWDFVIKAVSCFSILIDTLASYHGHVVQFQGYQQVKPIKLTTCSEGEFTCNDGQCISIEQRFLVSLFVVKNDQRWKWQIWQMFLCNFSHLVLFLLSYRFTKKEKCKQCYDHGFISTRL